MIPLDTIIQGDCLEEMKKLPGGCIDMILCDLPYGTTACKWDHVIPFQSLGCCDGKCARDVWA